MVPSAAGYVEPARLPAGPARPALIALVRRIARMSPDEIRLRTLQAVRKRLDEARFRLTGRLPRPARPSALRGQSGSFFFDHDELPVRVALLRERMPEQVAAIIAGAESIRRHRFDILGYTALDYGDPIDWHRDVVHGRSAPRKPWFRVPYLDFAAVGDHKIIWEINRHQHLVTLAKAATLAGESVYVEELVSQWYHWREQNPYPVGINWASSLEVAFRALAWLWVLHILEAHEGLPVGFADEVRDELALSATHIERYLSTYFAPNTHLLGEAVALFCLGVLCPMYRAAARWRTTGWNLVLAEARRQVRQDGMHFEQSTYYHVYALDFLLHARMLAVRNAIAVPSWFDDVLKRMAGFLHGVALNGTLPRLGDDDGGRVFDGTRNRAEHLLDPLGTCAVLFNRGEWWKAADRLSEETVWLLGAAGVERCDPLNKTVESPSSVVFPNSGIYSLGKSTPVATRLIVDAGPHGMGAGAHGHADALSVNLLLGGRQCLSDPGTYSYSDAGPSRNAYRGTSAHNTMRIDHVDQGDPGNAFAWLTMPFCRVDRWFAGESVDVFVGSHDGYQRLREAVTHQRWVVSCRHGPYLVRDRAIGAGTHSLEVFWHVGPDFNVCQEEPEGLILQGPAHEALMLASPQESAWSRVVREGTWSPAYGVQVPAPVVCFRIDHALPMELATVLVPRGQGDPSRGAVRVRTMASNHTLTVYRMAVGHVITILCFRNSDALWNWGGLASDAEFLLLTRDEARGRTLSLVVVGGTQAAFEDQLILQCRRPVDGWEWWSERGEGRVNCTDPSAVLNQGSSLWDLSPSAHQ